MGGFHGPFICIEGPWEDSHGPFFDPLTMVHRIAMEASAK